MQETVSLAKHVIPEHYLILGFSPVSQYSRGSSNDLHLATHQIIFFRFSPLRNRRVIPQPFHIALPYGQALTPRISV